MQDYFLLKEGRSEMSRDGTPSPADLPSQRTRSDRGDTETLGM